LQLEVFTQRNFVADFIRYKLTFIPKKFFKNAFSATLSGLRVVYVLQLYLIGKPVVVFIFVIIELFCYLLRLRRYKWKSVEVGEGAMITLSADLGGKGASPTHHCWCQSSRVIVLLCGIKISAVHHLDLSQSMRVTDGRRDRQNYDAQDRPRICSCGKN